MNFDHRSLTEKYTRFVKTVLVGYQMTGYTDTHVHTSSSPDADVPAAELIDMARGAGVSRVGFVAHLDMHPDDFCHGGFNEAEYLSELNHASEKQGVHLLRGLEIGEPHRFMGEAEKAFSRERYDFIIGALHWLGDRMILDEKPFLAGDPFSLVERYYLETLEILEAGKISILAHTGIFRRGMARAGLDCRFNEIELFPGLIEEVLRKAVSGGIALEVNTAGLRRPENTTYPVPSIIDLYRRLGGRMITLGSDTHRRDNAFFGLERGAALLEECGFTEYGFFHDYQYRSCPLHSLRK